MPGMRGFWRPLLFLTAALAVPIVPFLAFGDALEAKVATWLDPPPAPSTEIRYWTPLRANHRIWL